MYRFLLSPRWIAFIAFVVAVMTGCLLLANWQLDRLDERRARNAVVDDNVDLPPVPAAELLDVDRPFDTADQWRSVRVSGAYDAENQRLWRKRPYQGRVGFHVVVPLVGADGVALWVDRGWIAGASSATAQPEVPPLPEGTVDATVRVRTPAQGPARADDLPAGQIDRVAVEELSSDLGRDAYPVYGELVEETPTTEPAPALVPPPSTEEGPHLSYALQWVCFAVIAIVGLVIFARKERERVDAERGTVTSST